MAAGYKLLESTTTILLNQLKQKLFKYLTDSSSSIFDSSIPVSIVVGIGTPNGTQISGYGNLSKTRSTNADGNTIFDIASITKTFATILLMDMLKQGLVNRSDPLEKHLPC
jgi:serine-type D-Ala-D-Ala carboxypeptidase/endopeptidase